MISHVTRFINLNDRDFVIHPKPQYDELLSSWLVRVALANDTAATSFTNMHFREYARNIIWQRDLDIWCPQDLMKRLSEKAMKENYKNILMVEPELALYSLLETIAI